MCMFKGTEMKSTFNLTSRSRAALVKSSSQVPVIVVKPVLSVAIWKSGAWSADVPQLSIADTDGTSTDAIQLFQSLTTDGTPRDAHQSFPTDGTSTSSSLPPMVKSYSVHVIGSFLAFVT